MVGPRDQAEGELIMERQQVSGEAFVPADTWLEYQEAAFEDELQGRYVTVASAMGQAELVDVLVMELAERIAAHDDSYFSEQGPTRADYIALVVRALNAALANLACSPRVTPSQMDRAVASARSGFEGMS